MRSSGSSPGWRRRDAPAIAFGDVIGANVAICLVALGVGALVAPLPFGGSIMRYGLGGLGAGALATAIAWDGTVSRVGGAILVGAYVTFVAVIWILERRPPQLGETAELDEAAEAPTHGRVGVELLLVVTGVAAMAVGAVALVEGIRRISDLESTQTVLGLTVVGFATAFELVALAWSSARRGITPAVVAAVVGSYTYNATMTLGAGALARPLKITDATALHGPWLAMLASLALVMLLALPARQLDRRAGVALLDAYPVFIAFVLDAARPHRLYPTLHLAAHTGMRRGEIVGLKWRDLDVAQRRLAIRRALQCVGGKPAEFGVKTRTSRRTVELDAGTVILLSRWRRCLQRDGLPAGIDD